MDGLEIPLSLQRLKPVHSQCVRREVTTGNKHILSLYTGSILFPVQKTLLPQNAAWRQIFLSSWSSSEGTGEEVSWQDSQLIGCFIFFSVVTALIIHSIILQMHSYFAKSPLCVISPLHQLKFTIRWQSTNAFLRWGLLVAGEGCVSGPLVSELAGLCCSSTDYRGLPGDFPKVSYHLDHITMTFIGTNLI